MLKKIIVLISMGLLLFSAAGPGFGADTIKLGAPIPLTGWFASDGINYLGGIEMAVDELNINITDKVRL